MHNKRNPTAGTLRLFRDKKIPDKREEKRKKMLDIEIQGHYPANH